MTICPITYEHCEKLYSKKGLNKLSRNLEFLHPLLFSSSELRQEASRRVGKISIQGVQPKLSARLNVKKHCFELVDKKGHYILKPQIADYHQVPENEDLTMKLASMVSIDVPFHGLIYGKNSELTYFIRRFDRNLRNHKIHVEDFAQLSMKNRNTKYNSSMEQVIKTVEKFCTFPVVEKAKLFQITLFCFLTGNEDMHLKNFSMIYKEGINLLSPLYDLLNTTIVLSSTTEELALPLNGKKSKIKRQDLINYFAMEKLKLNSKVIEKILLKFQNVFASWNQLINISFLSDKNKSLYQNLISSRYNRIF